MCGSLDISFVRRYLHAAFRRRRRSRRLAEGANRFIVHSLSCRNAYIFIEL